MFDLLLYGKLSLLNSSTDVGVGSITDCRQPAEVNLAGKVLQSEITLYPMV